MTPKNNQNEQLLDTLSIVLLIHQLSKIYLGYFFDEWSLDVESAITSSERDEN